MWWEFFRYPSGDAQAQIYWRRRMLVLVLVAVVALLLLKVAFRGGGTDSVQPTAAVQAAPSAPASNVDALPASPPPTSSPDPAASGASGDAAAVTATPSPSSTASNAATNCAPGSMALRVASDATSYASGKQPVLTVTVVDVGTAPCTVDLGTKSTAISVLSGGKPVWTSNACSNKVSRPTSLTPAVAQALALRWDLSRNSSGCTASSLTLPAGQYEYVARVGGAAAYGGTFTLS